MTTFRAIASSFFFFSSAASCLLITSCSLSFHSFAHSLGISVQNRCGVTSRSGVRVDPDAIMGGPWAFKTMWGNGAMAYGRVGENVVAWMVWGGFVPCLRLVQPCPRLPQQVLQSLHSSAATLLQRWTE